MLTISKPLAATQAQTYHKTEFASPEQSYWAKEADLGQWQGRLAEEFGLSGAVSEEQFARLSQGQHPITGDQLVRHRAAAEYTKADGTTVKAVEHRAGWDATFSAPKSVSLVALVGGDDRVREAHREAVAAALVELERYTYARLGGDREAEQTGKFAAATFEHDTARPVDGYAAPQLHTHAVIFNFTRRPDGSTRALQPDALFDSQQFATAIYQSELTYRLRNLGYELEPGRSGAPEIKGITREYIEASSPRSQRIREYMEQGGYTGAAAAQIAAHNTREKKGVQSKKAVFAAHRAVAREHGDQADQVTAAARTRLQRAPVVRGGNQGGRIQSSITYAKERSYEREAVVDDRLLVRDALRYGMGDLRYQDIQPALEARVATGEFQLSPTPRHASGRRLTTPQMIAVEKSTIDLMRQGQNTQQPILSAERAAAYAATQAMLNSTQRQAVIDVLTCEDRVYGFHGLAGTGKTTTLSTIRAAAEARGYTVEGFAPTSKAAAQLREAGIEADTLQGFLLRQKDAAPAEKHLYMVDESSLASTQQMHNFLRSLRSTDRVLLVGDTRQHQGVDAGRPFEQMQDVGMRTAQLDRIVRQKDLELLAAVTHLSQNETRQGIALLQQQGRVTEVQDRGSRYQAIAEAYASNPRNTIIVSPDNASRRAINEQVREELRGRGLLPKENVSLPTLIPRNDMTGADRAWATQYRPGDVLYYSRGSKELGIEPRSYTTVRSVEAAANRLTVTAQDGRSITYDPRRLQGISAYQEIHRDFSAGDRIQFTAPNRQLGVQNRDLATIERIDEYQVSARLDGPGKRAVSFDAREMRHFDHGYAVTSHSSQGITAERVLVNMDTRAHPELINTRFAYVAVSRASQDAQIFTNDAAALGQRLSRDVSKSSAIQIEQEQSLIIQSR